MDRYLVVGNPIEHSLSPRIHAAFARQTGEAVDYGKALVAIGEFAAFVDGFVASGGRGLNVTVPFKLDAFDYVTERDERALAARAVNTIKIDDGISLGSNTDGVGLVQDLTARLGLEIQGSKLLILGAGGATQGILLPLIQLGPSKITIANRTLPKAEKLAELFRAKADRLEITSCGLDRITGTFDLVINGTSLGLSGARIDLDRDVIEGAFCYDLAYGPTAIFSAWAGQNGARGASDGLGMLVGQAAESFAIWRGVKPDIEPVYRQLRKEVDG